MREHQGSGSRTKRGQPVSCRNQSKKLLGADRDIIRIYGDIVAPLDVEWEAEADPDRVIVSFALDDRRIEKPSSAPCGEERD